MKRFLRWLAILGGLVLIVWVVSIPAAAYMKERRRVNWREMEVSRGKIVAVVNSTGTVKPIRQVQVGAFVSGPIRAIFVDFNDEVRRGQVLAEIDPLIYQAAEDANRAALDSREAELEQAKANFNQAINDEKRGEEVFKTGKDYISREEMDARKYKKEALQALVKVARTAIRQAQANLDNAITNLGYTKIRSPVDGVIIDRKIDPGQTVQASFQTPELFTVAPDMRREMHVYASVDEADIGQIREAQETNQPVQFTVDAYPDDLFDGTIYQIRKSATTNQNVVTYPVVVSAKNPDLKLYPGMTANLSFQLREKANVLRVPNAALRFFPQRDQVRPDDRKLLESKAPTTAEAEEAAEKKRTAAEKNEARRQRNKRFVWVVDGDYLRAVEIVVGLSDNNHTEVVSGELKKGEKVVTGIQPRN
jgi:HlyD family secretion protein